MPCMNKTPVCLPFSTLNIFDHDADAWIQCRWCRSFRPSVDAMHHFTIMRKRRTRGQPAHEPWANAIQVGGAVGAGALDMCA